MQDCARILHARLAWHVHAICPFLARFSHYLARSCTYLARNGARNSKLAGNYPARACASKGLCDRSWCLYIIYYISARTFFYLSKYSLSDAHFSTGRLLFEFNRLQYTLAAPEVFESSANLQILLFCRLGTGSASSETQTFTRSKPHPYGIAS